MEDPYVSFLLQKTHVKVFYQRWATLSEEYFLRMHRIKIGLVLLSNRASQQRRERDDVIKDKMRKLLVILIISMIRIMTPGKITVIISWWLCRWSSIISVRKWFETRSYVPWWTLNTWLEGVLRWTVLGVTDVSTSFGEVIFRVKRWLQIEANVVMLQSVLWLVVVLANTSS